MSLKSVAQEVREEKEFMPLYETVDKDTLLDKKCVIKAYTFYESKKDLYKEHPKTVIVAVEMDGKCVKAHFHNSQVVKAFEKVAEKNENIEGEEVTFKKVKLGSFDSVVIE